MYLSVLAGTFAGLALAAALAARRERLFLVVAALAAVMTIDALFYGIVVRFGPYGLQQPVLVGAILVSLAEAFGLPARVARLTRLGLRSAVHDYDLRLWRLIAPFETAVSDARAAVAGFAREDATRVGKRLTERLAGTDPPTPEWSRVRDRYVGAVHQTLTNLTGLETGRTPQLAWLAATREPGEMVVRLRADDPTSTRHRPPWAALVLLVTLPYTVFGPFDLANRTVIAPERPAGQYSSSAVASGWLQMTLPRGDSWAAGAVSDGSRVFLVSREDVHGFWGVTRVSGSTDGGETWSVPADAANDDVSNTARPTIALGPAGAVWVAFARQGQQVATQQLQIGESPDRGSTWRAVVRSSPPTIGLIGLPALLVTPDVHLVAYTDGTTGEAIVQQIGPLGTPTGAFHILGTTTRQLYSNAQFLDAGFALAAIGPYVMALWHSSDRRVEVSISEDAGGTWRSAQPIATNAAWARPHLLASGGRFHALVTQSATLGASGRLELSSTGDGALTWQGAATVSGAGQDALGGVVSHVDGGRWSLAYAGCATALGCTDNKLQIWFRDSPDGRTWSEPQALTNKGSYSIVGAGATAGREWAIWQHNLSVRDEDRVLEGASR